MNKYYHIGLVRSGEPVLVRSGSTTPGVSPTATAVALLVIIGAVYAITREKKQGGDTRDIAAALRVRGRDPGKYGL